MRISLLLSCFEAGMPLVGLLLGRAAGHAIGSLADYLAIGVLALVGIGMLVGGEEAEERRVAGLSQARGLALVGLGLSVSLDELAMGFSLGLLHVPVWLAVVLFGAQAFL